MPRIGRVVLEGAPHHITQRGNGRQAVFDTREGRRLYLDLLRRNCERFQLSVWAYCLMSNHVHLVAVPQRRDSMSRALGRTHAEYAQYLNLCRRSCGHVWQARFFSCPLSHTYLWNAMAYVERNPVRAGLCARAGEYDWSSARAHIRGMDDSGFLDFSVWGDRYDGAAWEEMLGHDEERERGIGDQLREATLRGRPCAEAEAIVEFEKRVGRVLRPQPGGRPRKRPAGLEEALLVLGNG